MPLEISKSYELMAKALNCRAVRADMISSNIANIDTPYYKARDIDFEYALEMEANKLFSSQAHEKLQLAKTDKMHLNPLEDGVENEPTIYFRRAENTRNDGNSVDLDKETTELAKNSVMYDALTSALKKDSMIFKSVLDASAKI